MPAKRKHISDEELLSLFYKTKDKKWLGVLLERYTMMLFGVCMKYLKKEDEAKDAVQQVFLKALTAIPKTKIKIFGAWIYQVARNECYSRLRQSTEVLEGIVMDHIEDEKPLLLKDWMAEERKYVQLERALSHLKEPQKSCISLFYFKEKSYKEIAELLKIDIKEVKSHIQNGKRNLKTSLENGLKQSIKGGDDE